MNQRRVDCLKRHHRDPEFHSETEERGTLAQRTGAAMGNTQISNLEGERKNVGHLFDKKTAFYTSTAQ
jgi:hypothetical protein